MVAHVIDAYLCEQDPYYYQDSLISELGIYSFLYPNSPYDSLVVVQMHTPPATVFHTKEICENETYDFFGTQLNEPGVYTATEQCITYRLALNVKSPTVIPMQEETCDGEPFDFFGELLFESGHYSTIVDCKKYELDLTMIPNSHVPILIEKEICEGETYSFFGRLLSYSGQYSATINCIDYQLDLTVNSIPSLRCSNDTLVEFGNPVELTATGADSYLWSTGDTTQSIIIVPTSDKDYWVQGFSQKGCSTASVTVRVNHETDEIVLFPNPANDKVEIFMPLIDEVEVFNLLGTRMYNVVAEREIVELDVSNFPSGMYIIHARQLNNHHYKKLVIQH